MLNAGFTSVWHWKQSAGCDAFSSFSSLLAWTLWQLMQLTLALACGERSKLGCAASVAAQALLVHFLGRVPWQD